MFNSLSAHEARRQDMVKSRVNSSALQWTTEARLCRIRMWRCCPSTPSAICSKKTQGTRRINAGPCTGFNCRRWNCASEGPFCLGCQPYAAGHRGIRRVGDLYVRCRTRELISPIPRPRVHCPRLLSVRPKSLTCVSLHLLKIRPYREHPKQPSQARPMILLRIYRPSW